MSERSGDRSRSVRRVRRVSAELDRERGVFMISVAAELAEMHPQTLRMYEARGLVTPKRSPKNTRLYSQEDVERLRRIQSMTAEKGLNLAGVETVLDLEDKLEQMRAELRRMRARTAEMERRMTDEVERVRRSLGSELVPYGAYEPASGSSTRGAGGREPTGEPAVRIPVERSRRRR